MRSGVAVLALAACPFVGLVSYGAGYLHGWSSTHRKWYDEQAAALAPIIADDPAFSRATIEPFSGGSADMGGMVATEEDLARLRSEFAKAVGEARAASGHFCTEVWPADKPIP